MISVLFTVRFSLYKILAVHCVSKINTQLLHLLMCSAYSVHWFLHVWRLVFHKPFNIWIEYYEQMRKRNQFCHATRTHRRYKRPQNLSFAFTIRFLVGFSFWSKISFRRIFLPKIVRNDFMHWSAELTFKHPSVYLTFFCIISGMFIQCDATNS